MPDEPTPEEIAAAQPANGRKPHRGDRNGETFAPDPHRMLPASIDAEQGVLCSALLDKDTIGLAVERGVSASSFHVPAHATIWASMLAMWEEQKPIDIVTLTQRLHDRRELEQCGGGSSISQLFGYLPTAANAGYYLDILLEKATLRGVIKVAAEFAGRAYSGQDDVQGVIDGFEQAALSIREFRQTKAPSIHELISNVIDDLSKSQASSGQISGLSTGFKMLDVMIDGLKGAEMIVIAARPSHGKTALAMNIAEHVALELHKPIGVFSLEMSAKQLAQRLLFSRARVNFYRWRDGFATAEESERISLAAAELSASKIFIDETSGISIQEAKAKARRWKSEHGIEALVFDYLQLGTSNTKRSKENRAQEVAEVSAGLKSIAKDLNIPVVVLAQLDRGVDKEKRAPRLSDLRESGAIEQDADVVGMLSREEMYAETDEQRRECEGCATLEIKKQRSGPLGKVYLTFLKEFTRFEARSEVQEPEIDPQVNFVLPDVEEERRGVDFKKKRGYARTGD